MKRMITLMAGFALAAVSTSTAQIQKRAQAGAPFNASKSLDALKNTKGRITTVKVTSAENRYVKAPKATNNEIDLLKEDFAGFTTGSYGNPDLETIIWMSKPEWEYPWINVRDGYLNMPMWGAQNFFPAGGMGYLRADTQNHSWAHVNTPMLDCSDNDAITYLQFDARSSEGVTVPDFLVEFAETNNMGPSWGNTGGGMVGKEVIDTWQTYTLTFEGTGPSTIFNIGTNNEFFGGGDASFYVDNVRVYQIIPNIRKPEALPHSQYKGTSFVANWNPVQFAEAYLLDVFEVDIYNEPIYTLQGQRVEGTSYEVTGLTSGKTYYYKVRAVDALGNESNESDIVEVFDIEAPKLTETAINESGKYTASWNEVPSAEVYTYYAAFKRKVLDNGLFEVTNEDLNNLTFDGAETSFDPVGHPETFDDEYPGSYPKFNMSDMVQAGWTATHYTPCKGYAAIDGWFAVVNPLETEGSLQSPELELNKDEGKFNVSFKLAGEGIDMTGWQDEEGKPMEGDYYSRAAVAVFAYDEAEGDIVQKEVKYQDVTAQWEDYDFSFTSGAERTIVGVFATRIPGILYVDDVKITQNARRGDIYNEPFLLNQYYQEGTSLEVEVPLRAKNQEVWHKVWGVKSKGETQDDVVIVDGQPSEYRKVGIAEYTGINNTLQSKMMVSLKGNTVYVNNPKAETVEVYSLDGRQLVSDHSGKAQVTAVLPGQGAYVVKVGTKSVKLTY